MKKCVLIISMLTILFIGLNASADTVYLNINNEGISGGPWGEVILTQNGSSRVDFIVDPYAAAFSGVGSNFGIQKFGFNENTSANLTIAGLPGGWGTSYNDVLDGFGSFNIIVSGTGSSRQDPLSFYVEGDGSISVSDFIILNALGYPFAAHIADFRVTGTNITSAWFSTGEGVVPIPEPATMLLLGSGLIGLAGVARKRFKK